MITVLFMKKELKPIKAKNFIILKVQWQEKLAEYTLNHLDFNIGERGKWRKYNPYNPYVEDNDKIKKTDLKVESLDDLKKNQKRKRREATE